MTRLTAVFLVVPVMAVATAATAQGVPDPSQCTMDCFCQADPLGGASQNLPYHCTICPGGDAPSEHLCVSVTIRDSAGNPISGATVEARGFRPDPPPRCQIPLQPGVAWCPSDTLRVGLTDASGRVTLCFDEGSVTPLGPGPTPVDFMVTANGVLVRMGGCPTLLQVNSYDLHWTPTLLEVRLDDSQRFIGDLGSNRLRSDFNHDGAVDPLDMALLAQHLCHGCGFTPRSIPGGEALSPRAPAAQGTDCPPSAAYRVYSDPGGYALPDTQCSIIGPIDLPDDGTRIGDIVVSANVHHTRAGDVYLAVAHDADENGIIDKVAELLCRPGLAGCDPYSGCCGCIADLAGNLWWSSGAATSVDQVCGSGTIATGCYHPDPESTGLEVFNGDSIAGDWYLLYSDGAGGDAGTLNGWSVAILDE